MLSDLEAVGCMQGMNHSQLNTRKVSVSIGCNLFSVALNLYYYHIRNKMCTYSCTAQYTVHSLVIITKRSMLRISIF